MAGEYGAKYFYAGRKQWPLEPRCRRINKNLLTRMRPFQGEANVRQFYELSLKKLFPLEYRTLVEYKKLRRCMVLEN